MVGIVSSMDISPKVILRLCLSDVDRIASSLDLCPKVKTIDHPIVGSCVLQVMLLHMMLLLIERSSVFVDDRVIDCCRI